MEIDLFTFFAQIVNFAILVILLNKFLFGRIRQAMEEREKKITDRMDEAERHRADAETASKQARETLAGIGAQKQKLLDEAAAAARQEGLRLLAEAKTNTQAEEKRWRQAMAAMQEAFLARLRETSADYAIRLSSRALRDLADDEFEARAVARFVRWLTDGGLKGEAVFAEAMKRSGKKAEFYSMFGLNEGSRSAVTRAVEERYGPGTEVKFCAECAPGSFMGLRSGGCEVNWGVDKYVEGIEEGIRREFEALKNDEKGSSNG